MTDRRPHWTDDLIEAVYDELPGKKWEWEPDSYPIYAVIAAVEDYWHDKGWGDITQSPIEVAILYNAVEARAEKGEAAIDRVRELHKGTPECAHCAGVEGMPDGSSVETCDECAEVMPCRTIRALDGEA